MRTSFAINKYNK